MEVDSEEEKEEHKTSQKQSPQKASPAKAVKNLAPGRFSGRKAVEVAKNIRPT